MTFSPIRFLSQLRKARQNFSPKNVLNDKKEYNVIIEVDKEENKKSFTSHSVVLRYRSTYFTKELEKTATNENHVKTIIKPNISTQIFEIILNKNVLNDKKEYNVIIEVDKEENKKSFTSHSVVLRYRSTYFTKELEKTATNENHVKTIIKPNISTQIFEIILKYIYYGVINIENIETKIIYELMIVANELEFEELSEKLESYLVESKASWLRTYFSHIYHSIFDSNIINSTESAQKEIAENFNKRQLDFDELSTDCLHDTITPQSKKRKMTTSRCNEFKGLNRFYNDIITKHPNLIFEYEDFTSLQEAVLISILEKDNLQLEEIEIWDYVIKWGIAQNPTLPKNEKLKPYRKILGTQLWDDLNQQLIFSNQPVKSLVLPARIISNSELPQRVNEQISTIINEEHVAEISSWIDRKSTIYSLTNVPYKLQLILRGSKVEKDNLQLEEIEIWDYVIKWGIAQNPTLPKNEKLKPYRKILGTQLWDDLNQQLIFSNQPVKSLVLPARIISNSELPQRVNEQISTIINEEHVAEISSWIDRKSTIYSLTNVPYKLQLILRGSKVGLNQKNFGICLMDMLARLWLLKFGDYNPLAWDNSKYRIFDTYMETNDSFIFSLKNGNIQNSILNRIYTLPKSQIQNVKFQILYNPKFQILSNLGNMYNRVKAKSHAHYYNYNDYYEIWGPCFGDLKFLFEYRSHGYDLTHEKICSCSSNSIYYEKSIRTTGEYFSILDYELFKIVKK
ncbi:hypothetical protein Glove_202g15 [Diversispora epigaea]|uniref:BTB domain-containing protein n=1 Tax=Diversispora epigaea TaxID=1348612 RepID=A0A397IU84_9GLOM|nr:hypothetical protein Glove_202g15 [Diversispora epigaea]